MNDSLVRTSWKVRFVVPEHWTRTLVRSMRTHAFSICEDKFKVSHRVRLKLWFNRSAQRAIEGSDSWDERI
jgi:hypothetical protein